MLMRSKHSFTRSTHGENNSLAFFTRMPSWIAFHVSISFGSYLTRRDDQSTNKLWISSIAKKKSTALKSNFGSASEHAPQNSDNEQKSRSVVAHFSRQGPILNCQSIWDSEREREGNEISCWSPARQHTPPRVSKERKHAGLRAGKKRRIGKRTEE